MGIPKSQVQFYLELCVQLVSCDPLGLTSPRSLRRDIQTLSERTAKEGLSFLSKTLPKLGKALDQGLAGTHFSIPREFKRSHENRSIPAFLQAYFKCVFDVDGNLLEGAEPAAVEHLRQVLFFAYKLELPYDSADESAVIDGFVATEQELERSVNWTGSATVAAAGYIARTVFSDFDPKDIVPRHGPGAVATGERLDEKWHFARLYDGIHQVYPYYDYFIVGGSRELIDRLEWYKSLERRKTGVAKVVLVPKDSRGPRLISCEPLEFQWIQQGLGRKMVCHMESFWMTKGHINFTHQEINQQLARESSISRQFATLDLKDASDRVSLDLVREVFKHTPQLLRSLEACRTSATELPDGRVITLKKYAPMGSALCFPVEAFVFWAIIVAAIARESRLPPQSVGKSVYVYGDDLVVPTEYAHLSMQALESVGLKVNTQKCCITGPFRESCGFDAFKGHKVTPLRLRKQWTGRSSDGAAYASYISLANALSLKGYAKCADRIWEELSRTYGLIPHGTETASYPCRVVASPEDAEHYNALHFKTRHSSRYQRIEFRVRRLRSRHSNTTLDSWPRLMRNIVSPSKT